MDKKLVDGIAAAMPKFPETIEDSYILSESHFAAINKAQAELGPEPDFHPQDGGNQPNPEWVKWFMVKNLCTEEQAIHIGCGKIDFEGDEISLSLVGDDNFKRIPSLNIITFRTEKECSIEQARKQGFSGTPEKWEQIKRKYAEDMVTKHGLGCGVDFTNILLGSRDMQDGDGDWHHFPE